jgi:hypothetical protein
VAEIASTALNKTQEMNEDMFIVMILRDVFKKGKENVAWLSFRADMA